MKTFKQFIAEADSRTFYRSKDDLLKAHNGELPAGHRAGYRPGPRGGWFASSIEDEKASKKRRQENIEVSTGQQTPREKHKVAKKRDIAKQRKLDVHHAADVATSGRIMRNMSPGDRLRFATRMRRHNIYLGDHPRNLVLANRGPASEFNPLHPGLHHKAYHEFETEHGDAIRDLPMSKMRAFTTLVNKERRKARRERLDRERRERTRPELEARMARAAERHGIHND